MTTANCPSCGAQIEFAIGSSAVVVCKYCHALVARTDRGVEDDGKVAALVDTGSPLRIGVTGKFRGIGYRLTGRTQMRHQAGGVWDEWYAAFDDGRWGWLAEAMGKFYLTFKTAEAHVPDIGELRLGAPVPQVDNFVVAEIGTATLGSAEGELPWRPSPGETYRYADLSGPEMRFATLDYSEEKPLVFKGVEATLDELGISTGAGGRQARVAVAKLSCSNCGAPLELRAPDQAERVFCPHCGAGHDVAEGTLRPLALLQKKKVTPLIPLGKSGTIDGTPYVVAGFMERSVTFDRKYYWTEYLLYNQRKGFRWLVDSDDHWSFVEGISVADVIDTSAPGSPAREVPYKGRTFKLFQDADATVEYVLGEFYWKVEVGEKVLTADYIRPPEGLSKETTTAGAQEVNWSHAVYMPPEAVEKAFGVSVPRPRIVGPMQPAPSTNTGKLWAMFVAAAVVIAIVIGITRANRVVYKAAVSVPTAADWTAPTTTAPPAPPGGKQQIVTTVFSPEFDLPGGQNLEIAAHANVTNSWAYVGGDLMNVNTGAVESFELPVEYYAGVDQGESWSEGSRNKSVYISAPPKGRYALRMDVQWEKADGPVVAIEAREGVFRWTHLLALLIALTIPTVFNVVSARSFEVRRWRDSDYSPYHSSSKDDDDGDDE